MARPCFCYNSGMGNLRRNPLNFLTFPSKRRRNMRCKVCGIATSGGKTFCKEHIDEQSYVQYIYEKQKLIDREVEGVRNLGIAAIDPDSSLVESVLTALNFEGGLFPNVLSAHSDIPEDVIGVYIRYLTESGQAGVVPTKNSLKVYLAESPELDVERTLSVKELLMGLGWDTTRSNMRLIQKYSRLGAPRDKINNRYHFNLEEFKLWYKNTKHKRVTKRSQLEKRKYKSKIRKIRKAATSQGSLRLLTREELSKVLDVSVASITRWLKFGVPHDVVGKAAGTEHHRIRLFDPEEVRIWHQEHVRQGAEARGQQGYGEEFWNEIFDYLRQGHSYADAEEKFGVSHAGIRNRIRDYSVVIETPEETSTRTMTRVQVAEALKVSPHTVWTWTTKGAPFEMRRPGSGPGGKEVMFFDAKELKKWRKKEQTRERKQRGEYMSKALRMGFGCGL